MGMPATNTPQPHHTQTQKYANNPPLEVVELVHVEAGARVVDDVVQEGPRARPAPLAVCGGRADDAFLCGGWGGRGVEMNERMQRKWDFKRVIVTITTINNMHPPPFKKFKKGRLTYPDEDEVLVV